MIPCWRWRVFFSVLLFCSRLVCGFFLFVGAETVRLIDGFSFVASPLLSPPCLLSRWVVGGSLPTARPRKERIKVVSVEDTPSSTPFLLPTFSYGFVCLPRHLCCIHGFLFVGYVARRLGIVGWYRMRGGHMAYIEFNFLFRKNLLIGSVRVVA